MLVPRGATPLKLNIDTDKSAWGDTVTVKLQLLLLPEPSTTSKIFVVIPTGNTLPLGSPDVCVVTAPEQLSVPTGVE